MRQVLIKVRYADSGYGENEGFYVNVLRSQKINISIEGEDSFDWTKDLANAYRLWAKVNLPLSQYRSRSRLLDLHTH